MSPVREDEWPSGLTDDDVNDVRQENETLRERIGKLEAYNEHYRSALKAVLLFHSTSPWDDKKRHEWERYSGGAEATTRILCSLVRVALETK